MKNQPNDRMTVKLTLLGLGLIVWSSCGGSDDVVVEDNPVVVLTGGLSGEVERLDGVQITVRVLRDEQIISSTTASPDGRYQVDNLEPGAYTVRITAKGYETTVLTAQIRADGLVTLDRVTLDALAQPVAHIRGFLSDQFTKQALGDVRILLLEQMEERRESLASAAGGFGFETLPPDAAFTLVINHDGYEPQEISIAPIPPNETAKITIELTPIAHEAPPVGDGLPISTPAPDFSAPDADGRMHSLADFKGRKKVVLIFYRGSW